jgi:hypothetical protein
VNYRTIAFWTNLPGIIRRGNFCHFQSSDKNQFTEDQIYSIECLPGTLLILIFIIYQGVNRKTGYFFATNPISENPVITLSIPSKIFLSLAHEIPDNVVSETNFAKKPNNNGEIFHGTWFWSVGRGLYPQGNTLERCDTRPSGTFFGLTRA